MGKLIRISLIITVMVVVCTGLVGCTRLGNEFEEIESEHQSDEPIDLIFPRLRPAPEVEELVIERITCTSDQDGDGLNDLDDIVEGARKDIENKPRYTDAYYEGGYPPDDEGVCTDVIWRALKNAGFLLKDMVDEDIRKNIDLYPRVQGHPDPNIDFRRIKNLRVFFDRFATILTTEITPLDVENLKEWQAGDIVVFDDPMEHIAIISEKRNKDGVPYIIHNCGPYTQENDMLIFWHENYSPIIAHYRFPKK
jgi:uncharacterized protein YijF (DUF1287 family)